MKNLKYRSGEIFVFGSNREGRHGAGAARHARLYYGAEYGKSEGLQGSSYAIITKELRSDHPPVTLSEVKKGVLTFLEFAKLNHHMTFRVTEIGCRLAGFKPQWIAPFFRNHPKNVLLPKSFKKVLNGKHH